MLKYLCLFVLVLTAAFSDAVQGSLKPTDAKPDYSKEAFVDEEDLTKIAFENDGTSTREASFRVRIQSDAGVQRYSVDTYGIIPGANINWVDGLDRKTTSQQTATQAQLQR